MLQEFKVDTGATKASAYPSKADVTWHGHRCPL